MQAIQGGIAEEGTELDNLLFANERLIQANEAQKEKRSISTGREVAVNQESTNPFFSSMNQPMPETSAEEHVNANSSSLPVAESAQVGFGVWGVHSFFQGRICLVFFFLFRLSTFLRSCMYPTITWRKMKNLFSKENRKR